MTGAAFAAGLALAHTAHAQRAGENTITSADDAFGSRVGNDTGVGIYDMRNARGFDPQQAGNIRVEGMYIDIQGMFGARLNRSQNVRVGISAQSYPFPAPTGIVEIGMYMPADKLTISPSIGYQTPTGMQSFTLDVATPLGDKLGTVFGVNRANSWGDGHVAGGILTMAGLFRWRPNDDWEVIPFFYNNNKLRTETNPSVFLGSTTLPPEWDRDHYYGQPWTAQRSDEQNYGVITRANIADGWRLQNGVFHTQQKRFQNDVVFYRNVQANGVGNLDVLRYPEHFAESYSGEVRLSGVFTQNRFRHTIHIGARGRDTFRRFGGGSTVSLGPATVGVYQPRPEPLFTLGTRDEDAVRQVTPGVAYVGQWAGVGEASFGVQKSFYHREYTKANTPLVTSKSQPWLYNGTISWTPTTDLAFYASYTRGVEEFGTAPDNAANAGEPMPVKQTKQIDGGIRYRLMPGVNLVAGLFKVSKPYFDRNTANIYTDVGSLVHRGAEFSLAGKVIPNLTIVGGAVLLQARVSGLPVQQGTIGRVPQGVANSLFRLSLQYDVPALKGFSVDTQVESNGAFYANRLNTLRIGSSQTLAVGARYQFNVSEVDATFRVQMQNVTNAYDWNVDPASGRLSPTVPRKYVARLSADF